MSTAGSTVVGELERDLASARLRLAEARIGQQRKDTPVNRRTVAACLAGIDALLDMYLDSRPGPPARPRAARGEGTVESAACLRR